MKTKIYHRGNVHLRKLKYEKAQGENLTVPGQTETLRQLLVNYIQSGQAPPLGHQVYHDGFDNFNVDTTLDPNFDLTDMDEILSDIEANKAKLEALRNQYDKEQKEKENTPDGSQNAPGANPPES